VNITRLAPQRDSVVRPVLAGVFVLPFAIVIGLAIPFAGANPAIGSSYLASLIAAPTGSPSGSTSIEDAVSCPPSGPCVAVGAASTPNLASYEATASTADTSGVFGQSITPSTPAGSEFFAISCSASGSCTAVGIGYPHASSEAIAATMKNGAFVSSVAIKPPAPNETGGPVLLSAVSCTSPGNCVAVGSYHISQASYAGMVATEISGKFSQAVMVTPPSGSEDLSQLNGISCGSPTSCVAVGSFQTTIGAEPMTVAISNGVVQPSQTASLPAAATTGSLAAISCSGSLACLAVGGVQSGSLTQPYVVTASSGEFNSASQLSTPADLLTQPGQEIDELTGVGCASFGNCTMVGNYTDKYLKNQSSVYSEAGGVFSLPSNVAGTGYATFVLNGAACDSSGNCAVVGNEIAGSDQDTPSSSVYVQDVPRATPTLTTTATGQTSYDYYQGITDSATLSGGSGSRGGDLLFLAYGPADPTCSAAPVVGDDPVLVSGAGTYQSPTASVSDGAGTYNWVVIYSGDAGDNQVISPCGTGSEQSIVHLDLYAGNLGEAYLRAPYTGYVEASGGTAPYKYRMTGGSLPHGLSLNSTGTFNGSPDKHSQAGLTFTFDVSATDSTGATGAASLSITVAPHPRGSWLVGSDGIFTFGAAVFFGSTG
jgi:large repetitive protein